MVAPDLLLSLLTVSPTIIWKIVNQGNFKEELFCCLQKPPLIKIKFKIEFKGNKNELFYTYAPHHKTEKRCAVQLGVNFF